MTVIDLCNNALADISHDRPITSLTDGTAEAARCARFWPRARRSVLSAHPWGFLTATEPACEIDLPDALADPARPYAYARPSDALTLAAYGPDGIPVAFLADSTALRSATTVAAIAVTRDSEDIDAWPPAVQEAVIAALALKLASPITANGRIMQAAAQQAAATLARARSADARATSSRPGTPNRYAASRQS